MIPATSYADPERAVVAYLDARTDEPVSTWFPASSTDAPPTLPFVQVGWDGTPRDLPPAAEIATVRVTYWAAKGSYTAAKQGASKARGLLLAHPGDASVWGIDPGIGRLPGVDPDTDLPFCTFTVQVRTKPVAA